MDDLSVDSEDIEMEESESVDRLSELPDSLIHAILSLLPMRDVVKTTFLSKRWRDLWTLVPCLSFSDNGNDFRFKNFVNRVLAQWKGAKISTFKIEFPSYRSSDCHDVDYWLHFAMWNKVEELYISLMDYDFLKLGYCYHRYCSPQCLLCSSIRKLPLYGCGVQWSQLKSLRIDSVPVNEHAVDQISSCAPQLEVLKLHIIENLKNLDIRSSSLKKLMIEKCLRGYEKPAKDTMLTIWAPTLEILEFAGIPYSKCVLINVSSLTDVTLGFYTVVLNDGSDFAWNQLLGETLSHIFPKIHHVKRLTLSHWCIEVIGVMEKTCLYQSSFGVQFLKLKVDHLAVEEILFLLEIFPRLKMLAVELIVHHFFPEVSYKTFRENWFLLEEDLLEREKDLSDSFLLQLRTVEITWVLRDATVFPFIEFLLKHAIALQKMVIHPERTYGSPELFHVGAARKLVSLQRSFPNVELILCDNQPSYIFRR